MGSNLLFEAEIFFFFSSVIAESFFLTEQKKKGISAFRVVTKSCCSLELFSGLTFDCLNCRCFHDNLNLLEQGEEKKTSENLFLQALTFIAVLWLMDWNKYAKKVSRIKKIK